MSFIVFYSNFKLVIGEVQLQVSYYNANVGSWEPLIEPVVEVEKVYRPWEVLFKVIQLFQKAQSKSI